VILVIGGQSMFPWVRDPTHGKGIWLSAPFLFGRDGLIFLLLFYLSYKFVYFSIRPDLGLLKQKSGASLSSSVAENVIKDWRGWELERQASEASLTRRTPVLLIAFAVLYSFIGFDLVMALDPHWYSTLFGWLYFLHAFFAALVVITITAVVSSKWLRMEEAYTTNQWHDMGRLVFGFCLLSGGFFWSQFLVIWYGNLPEETSYLIKRFYSQPWEPLMWVYLVGAYLLPLTVFLSKRVKQVPVALLAISFLIFIALFLERYIAVVPFIWHEATIPFGPVELCVTLGYAGAFLLCWLAFARVVPIVPAGNPTTAHH
jgi:hypothetical protein